MSAGSDADTERQLEDVNVVGHEILTTPEALKREHPLTDAARATVSAGRSAVRDIPCARPRPNDLSSRPAPPTCLHARRFAGRGASSMRATGSTETFPDPAPATIGGGISRLSETPIRRTPVGVFFIQGSASVPNCPKFRKGCLSPAQEGEK